jgi:hypothetical protein
MTWDPNTQPQDEALIDGLPAPGPCTLTKFDRKRRIMKVEPYGALGARAISLGKYLAEFAIRIELVDSDSWARWYPFSAAIDRIPIGPKGRAASIVYAPLAAHGITECLLDNIEGPLPDGETGGWYVTISASQWVPIAKPSLSSPSEANKPPGSTDPVDRKIDELTEIAKMGGPDRLGRAARALGG